MNFHLPVIQGVIDRRILVNFRVEPDVAAKLLPPPFRPKLANGFAMMGICLIRLKYIRPRGFPAGVGISSENAAHRIAVEWEAMGERREGVFIPRRDTSAWINTLTGGRIFPGVHHRSEFFVTESNARFHIEMQNHTDGTHLSLRARLVEGLSGTSIFASVAEASEFFRHGALGYSTSGRPGHFDGLELRSLAWHAEPLGVEHVESSFFANEDVFPRDSVKFDCALLMRNIPHEWLAKEPLCCPDEN